MHCMYRIQLGISGATLSHSASFLVSLQVNAAFAIVYESGLNEYALYLDCEGQERSHRGYERTMSHLFKNYKKPPHIHKVSVSLCEQMLLGVAPLLQILTVLEG